MDGHRVPDLVQAWSSTATTVGNAGLLEQLAKHSIYRAGGVFASTRRGEEEILWLPRPERFAVLSKPTPQPRRDRHKAIPAKFALFDPQYAFGQVDVCHLQTQCLSHAQPTA